VTGADLLANVERPPTERPQARRDDVDDPLRGYWYGPAVQWKARALASEAEVSELRRQLARSRGRP
jgi:hypothetical protein